jgi:hypothetical protein
LTNRVTRAACRTAALSELAATLKWHDFCPVKEKLHMRNHNDPLRNLPQMTFSPPARCFYRREDAGGTVCGELAAWVRPGLEWFRTLYFCDEHREPIDLEIPPVHAIRRVRINAILLFSAASLNQAIAHTEALARLEAAVHQAGGLLDVEDVASTWGKSSPPPRLGSTNGAPADRR